MGRSAGQPLGQHAAVGLEGRQAGRVEARQAQPAERQEHGGPVVPAQAAAGLGAREQRPAGHQSHVEDAREGREISGERQPQQQVRTGVGRPTGLGGLPEHGLPAGVVAVDPVPGEVGQGHRREARAGRRDAGAGRDVGQHHARTAAAQPLGLLGHQPLPARGEGLPGAGGARLVDRERATLRQAHVTGAAAEDQRLPQRTPKEPLGGRADDGQRQAGLELPERPQHLGGARGVAEAVPGDVGRDHRGRPTGRCGRACAGRRWSRAGARCRRSRSPRARCPCRSRRAGRCRSGAGRGTT